MSLVSLRCQQQDFNKNPNYQKINKMKGDAKWQFFKKVEKL